MLTQLSVKNFALIHHLNISFKDNLTVITGETGAGKSILLGALDLILGKRADTTVLMNKAEKCIVEGTFSIGNYNLVNFFNDNDLDYDITTIIRREITPNGKSRAFINDTPVNLALLKELCTNLIDLHSQNQNLSLADNDFHQLVVDSFTEITKEVQFYSSRYQEWQSLKKEIEKLLLEEKQSNAEKDYLEFILSELIEADLKKNEQEALENELKELSHIEEIKTALTHIVQGLENENTGVINVLHGLISQLKKVASFSTNLHELSKRFESTSIEINDLLSEAESLSERIEHNPQRTQEITDRLNLIYTLQAKHHVNTVEELVDLVKVTQEKLNKIQSISSDIEMKSREFKTYEIEVKRLASDLSKKRINIFPALEKRIETILHSMGIPNSKFSIKNSLRSEPGPNGYDTVNFQFNANRGGELQDISKVASGGEKSRLMLAIKSILSQKRQLPTIIFDEVDTGISGSIADKVGSILKELSDKMQVITITHLPQIASKGDHHLFVFKETSNGHTQTQIKALEEEERIIEIAKLMSGTKVTDASIESAKYLLKN
ncbi:MAG: DNA repair protein RecN [Bacteroidales bacterium]|nr:DNA repair protein RecN [Bacteroidales bacterium]MCF8403330.1 DNA repair protein RecN [Bacteroidales bacterium]